jgi:putative MATE family efflux protein
VPSPSSPPRPFDRSRLGSIVAIALPIMGGMASQNLLNLVDTAMVGTLGATALAAVGLASMVNFAATAFITGLSTGVQAMAARRKGEGRDAETGVPLNGGLLVATALAIPLSVALIAVAPWLLSLLADDPALVATASPYLRVRLVAMVALGANFAFRGFWNGIGRSRIYMRTLVVMHVANVVLNWVFIFGNLGAPALGATGAGLATTIATFLGTAYYVALGLRHARGNGFLRGLPDAATLRTMLRLAIPSGIQQLFFAAGMTALFTIVARVGTEQTAAANVIINITLVAILPSLGLGLGAASLVGQALGRGDPDDAERWGWDVVRVATLLLVAIGLPMLVVPDLLLSGFIHDPATLALGRTPLRLVGLTIWLDGVGLVLLQCLLGAGATRTVLVISVGMQWGVFLPAAWLIGPTLGFGLLGIWLAQACYRGAQAAVLAGVWRRRTWTAIKV